jgi:hypothetical protein
MSHQYQQSNKVKGGGLEGDRVESTGVSGRIKMSEVENAENRGKRNGGVGKIVKATEKSLRI